MMLCYGSHEGHAKTTLSFNMATSFSLKKFSKTAILEGQTFGGPSLVIVINMAQV